MSNDMMKLLEELVEAPGTHGAVRKLDWDYMNGGCPLFKRVGDTVLLYNLGGRDMHVLVLLPGEPFGMGSSTEYSDYGPFLHSFTLAYADYGQTTPWKLAALDLDRQRQAVRNETAIQAARAAMRQGAS